MTARCGVALSHPVGADQGPAQARVWLPGPAQSLKDLGKFRGPVGDHPQSTVAGTCRPWPGSPSSPSPGSSGRCPPPSTSARAPSGARQMTVLCQGRASCAPRWAANHRLSRTALARTNTTPHLFPPAPPRQSLAMGHCFPYERDSLRLLLLRSSRRKSKQLF